MANDYGDGSSAPPPALAEREQDVLSWCLEAVQEGEQFLRAQPGIEKVDPTISAIMSAAPSSETGTIPGPLSKSDCHQLGKIALDLRSGLTDTKMFWEYSTKNRRYENAGDQATKLAQAWWLNSQADMRFTDAISWCFAAGSAALRLVYDKSSGEQQLQAWDVRDVLPVRPNNTLDYDSAFAVILRKENTVNYLRGLYPSKAQWIRPDRDGAYARLSSSGLWDKVASVASPLLRGLMRDSARTASTLKVPSCDTFTIEVKDDSLNTTGRTVLMGPHDSSGKATASWSYAVEPNDALYPRGRTIVLTKSVILYDGPNIYWHGGFDVLKFTLDAWPFSWLGKSPMWDLLPLQGDLRDTVRLIANLVKKIQRPGVVGDKNNVSRAAWDKIDTALAGMKVMQNPSMGKGIQVEDVSKYAGLIPVLLNLCNFYIDRMEFISGSKDITNMAELNQIPSSETIEKMMEAMSPAIRSRSRTMEAFLRKLASMWLANCMQFITPAERYRRLGPQASALELFDTDPGTLLPDYVHADDFDKHGQVTSTAKLRGPRPRYERAKEWLPQFELIIEPNSLLKASEVSEKLLYLQLGRAGWVDPVTIMERLGVHDIGLPADFPTGILQRLQYLQQMQVAQTEVSPAGRKASGQQMPQMRGDGKISESGG